MSRDPQREESPSLQGGEDVKTQDGQRDDGSPDVADGTQGSTETMEAPCPAEDCDSDRASSEMVPKPGGSDEVRLFTCVECGHKWRES